MSSDTMMSEESWPEEDAPEHRNSRNEQPMSPFVVIRELLSTALRSL